MVDTTRQDDGHLSKKDDMHLDRWQRNSGAERKRGAPEGNLNSMRHGTAGKVGRIEEETGQ